METKRKSAKVAVSLLALAGLAVFSLFAVGGSLEPSAPPGPTMKTLDEVEPRIPIHASDLPLTIATPGSYYLAENITTGGGGITIDANNVTIDLMGFSLAGGTGDGIFASTGRKNIAIKNGTVSGWSGRGVSLFNAVNSQLANLRASDNGFDGLLVGAGCTVTNCTAWANGGRGIWALGNSGTVTNCTGSFNSGDGLRVGFGSTVTNCTARQNGGDGIFALDGSTVTNCTASDNGDDGIVAGDCTVINCTASDNGDDGIVAGDCTVINCMALANTGDGIQVSWGSRVVGNTCDRNGNGGDGAGIHVRDRDNRIEANNVIGNDRGIDVDMLGNLIIKNSASGNTTDYDIVAGNTVGPILGVADPIASTNPWANFAF